MALDNTLKTGIKASIAAALLMLFILEPAIRAGWSVLVRLTPGVFRYLVNSAYENAALGNRNWVVALLAMLGLGTLACIAIGILVAASLPDKLRLKLLRRKRLLTLEQRRRRRCRRRITAITVSVLGLFALVNMIAGIFIDLQLNTGFEQRLAVLAAVVPDAKIKTIKSSWAQMKTREDYLKINEQMEEIANNTGVTLPAPLLP
jgi:hypothetical protein